MDSGKSNGLRKGLVLKASYLGLMEGSKLVYLVGNPNGQGCLNKKMERAL